MKVWQKDILRYQLIDAFIYWFMIPAGVIGTGWLFDQVLRWPRFQAGLYLYSTSVILITLGSLLITAAMRDFSRFGQGTANPRRPPVKLVQQGIYAFCRHPMFLGYDLAALGVVLLCQSPATLLISFPGFLIGQVMFLKKEERYLSKRFKQEFASYQKRVPFLLPLIVPRRSYD